MIQCPQCGAGCREEDVVCSGCGCPLVFGPARHVPEAAQFPPSVPEPGTQPIQHTYPAAPPFFAQNQVAGQHFSSPAYFYPAYPVTAQAPTNSMATLSMVLGIVCLALLATCFLGVLAAIPSVVLGFVALSRIRRSPFPQQGKGFAITGIVCGFVTVALTLLFVIVMIILSFYSIGQVS